MADGNRGGGGGGRGGGGRGDRGSSRFGDDNDTGTRGDTTPCPSANGTTIGTFQQFRLQCGRTIGGDILDQTQQPTFLACIDNCASVHPRCDAVTYNGTTCFLRSGSGATDSRTSQRFDSAVGIFPDAPADSGCAALGASATFGTSRFDVSCDFVLNGNDMFQEHTTNFPDCLALCARTVGCGAVSFDRDMDQGFKNCYVKSGIPGDGLLRVAGTDSAVVNGTDANLASPSAPSTGVGVIPVPVPGAPATSSSPLPPPSATTPPAASPPAQGGGGAITLTPLVPGASQATSVPNAGANLSTTGESAAAVSSVPVGSSAGTSASPAVDTSASPLTESSASLLTETSASPSAGLATTQSSSSSLLLLSSSSSSSSSSASSSSLSSSLSSSSSSSSSSSFVTSTRSSTSLLDATTSAPPASSSSGTANFGGDSAGSGASGNGGGDPQTWIVAPILGSLAAVALVAVIFFLLRKKKKQQQQRERSAEPQSPGGASAMSPAGVAAWIRSWLPRRHDSFRFDPYASRRSYFGGGRKLRDKAGASDPEKLQVDDNMRHSLADDDDDGPTPTYELRKGRMTLRNSQNGLMQNKPNFDGITSLFKK